VKPSRTSSLLSDGAILLLFVLCFIAIVFISGDPDRYLLNIILLNVGFLIAIATYFTNVTTGLVLNMVFIFGYGTVTLYQTVIQGQTAAGQSYFWLIMIPLLTVAVWMLTLSSKQMQTQIEQLRTTNASLATLDENTNLRNTRSFHNDADVFMALSARYSLPLTLLVIHVKYWDEVRNLISGAQVAEAIRDVSRLSESSIRMNDTLYMLSKDNPTWAMLLFTDREGAGVVTDRLKQRLLAFNTVEFADKYKVKLDLVVGFVQYNPEEIATSLDFIRMAKKQLEYDV